MWSIFFQAGVVFILWLALMLMIVAYIVVVVNTPQLKLGACKSSI